MSEPKEQPITKMGTFAVTPELLSLLLLLPDSDIITDIKYEHGPFGSVLRLTVSGNDKSELPIVKEGEATPEVSPTYHKDETGKVTFVKY